MSDFLQLFKDLEASLAQEKGPFDLFAVFERQDLPTRLDLLVSAPWAEADNASALRYIAAEIKSRLPTTDYQRVSRIVFLDPQDERVRALVAQYRVGNEPVEVEEATQFGLPAEHGYIIAARPAA